MSEQELKALLYNHTYICRQIKRCHDDIKALKERVHELYELNIPGHSEVRTREITDPTYRAVEKIQGLLDKQASDTEHMLAELLPKRLQVERLLLLLTPPEREIVEQRYFHCKRWEEIARAMHYSVHIM